MRNTGKALVAGLVLAELAFGAYYLMSPKGDRSTNAADAAATGSVALTGPDSQAGATHVIAGSVDGASQPTQDTDDTARVQAQSQAGRVAPKPEPPSRHATQELRPKAQPHQELAHTPESVEGVDLADSKTGAVPPAGRGRESLRRHDSNAVASAMTDELVKESAQLDPALPPPPAPYVPADQSHRGSNPVAAAMTDQLVKESAKLDPALPPPAQPGAK